MEKSAKKKKKTSVANVILYLLSAALLTAGVYLLVVQYIYIPSEKYQPPPTPTPVLTVTPSPTPTSGQVTETPTATPLPTPEPTPTPYIRLGGPNKMWFTGKQIECVIQPVGRIETGPLAGKMATIDSATIAAWYEPGPEPGEPGNSLINGHVRWKGVAGVFQILHTIDTGEEVVIGFVDGTYRHFYVVSRDIYQRDKYPPDIMGDHGDTRVTLITCHGEFDRTANTSVNRCFVVLKLKDDIIAEAAAGDLGMQELVDKMGWD